MYECEHEEYRTNETEVMEYTKELRNTLPNPSRYGVIFRCFVDKRMPELASIMTDMLKQAIKYKNISDQKENEIQHLKKQLEDRDKRIADLQQMLQLSSRHGKISSADMMQMKVLYEKGDSLRKLSKMFNCDKNTVKQRLLEMGVQLRSNSGR